MRTARFEPGETVWRIGAPSGFMYAMASGRVRCTTEDGRHFVCGPGYPRGNLESQCGAPRWYDAVADTPVTAFRYQTDAFLDTIEQHFEMALEFLATMATGLIARRAEMRKETESTVVA
ncbi:MAG: cyclic nucleotide-binding domain-containing protein [bacterium]